MGTFTGYYVITGANGAPLNNVTVELMEIIEFTPASPDPQEHIVATGTTDEAGEVTFGSLDDTKRYFARPRVTDARVHVVLPTSVGGSGAPASASFVTINAEAGLSAETQHSAITGASLHVTKAHHDEHDPQDGADALDCATPPEISVVVAASEGSAHEFARADHVHAINHAITDNHIVTVDGTANAPTDDDYAKWTTLGLEGRSYSQVRTDINVADGADVTGDNAPKAHSIASHDDTTATGAELETLTDGSDTSLHIHDSRYYTEAEVYTTGEVDAAFIAKAFIAAKGDLIGASADNTPLILSMGTDTHVLTADSGEATGMKWAAAAGGGATTALDNLASVAINTSLNSDTDDTDNLGTNLKRWKDLWISRTINIDGTPANDTCTGITTERTAGTALTRGQLCYVGADGKMEKALATAESMSRVIAICEEASIAENAAGTFLLHGFFEAEFNFGTLGAKIYLSDDTAGAHDETQPAGTDECIVIVGIAMGADLLYFNPQVQAIVEHT